MSLRYDTNPPSPVFGGALLNVYVKIGRGSCLCVCELLEELKRQFCGRHVAICSLSKENALQIHMEYPGPKGENIETWLDTKPIRKKSVCSARPVIDKFGFYQYPCHVDPDDKEEAQGDFNFVLVKLPAVFDNDRGSSAPCVILTASPFIEEIEGRYGFEGNELTQLVNSWASHILHYRHRLSVDLANLKRMGLVEEKRSDLLTSIRETSERLLPMMTFRELIHVARELVRPCERDKSRFPVFLLDLTKGDSIIKWSQWKVGSWPVCTCSASGLMQKSVTSGRGLDKRLCSELVRLSWWVDASAPAIGTRRDGRDSPTHPGFGAFNRGMALAFEASGKLVNTANLLPSGLFLEFFSGLPVPLDNNGHQLDCTILPTSPQSDKELAGLMSALVNVAHYLLAEIPCTDDVVQSIMLLVSEYGHRALGIPLALDLRAHLLQAARGEPALHSLKNYYRDHFFHALEVCLLGHFLLDLEIPTGDSGPVPLWTLVARNLPTSTVNQPEGDRRRVLRLWYITSLLHDIGYSIDVQRSVLDLLSFFRNCETLAGFTQELQECIGHLSEAIGAETFQGYETRDEPGKDHGIIGAYHLQSLLARIAKDDKRFPLKDYNPAIRAIALHNSRRQTVVFKDDPLAFLLILCDTIQEWNRPRLDFATAPIKLLSRLMQPGIQDEDFTGPLKTIQINGTRTNGDVGPFRIEGDTLHFLLAYEPEIQRNGGVFNLWVDASCNFQRLDFAGFPNGLNIDVEYVTPYYSDVFGKWQQLHRLREAAFDTHMGFLDDWFPTEQGATPGHLTNGALSYWTENDLGDSKLEHLVLHLRTLAAKKPVQRSIEVFRERLRKWKDYGVDRVFDGDYGADAP